MSDQDPDTLKVIDFGVSRIQDKPRCGSNWFLLLNHEATFNVPALCCPVGFMESSLSLLALCRLPDYGRIGTPSIRAPEVTLGLSCTTAIDMWSLGCCLIELLIGKPAFQGHDEMNQLKHTIEVTAYYRSRQVPPGRLQAVLEICPSWRHEWACPPGCVLDRSVNQPAPVWP